MKLDFEQRQEVIELMGMVADPDGLEAALHNIIWERDAARDKMTEQMDAINEALNLLPASMGGYVTLAINVLQKAKR